MKVVALVAGVGLLLGSCMSSNNVVNNKLISKRKYTKGFFINGKGSVKGDKNADTEAAQENMAYHMDLTPVKAEETAPMRKVNTTVEKSSLESSNVVFASTTGDEPKAKVNKKIIKKSSNDKISSTRTHTAKNSTGRLTIQEKKEAIKKAMAPSSMSTEQLVYVILLIILIILVFSLLDRLTGGTFGWIVGLVLTILLIYLILRWLGVV